MHAHNKCKEKEVLEVIVIIKIMRICVLIVMNLDIGPEIAQINQQNMRDVVFNVMSQAMKQDNVQKEMDQYQKEEEEYLEVMKEE